MGGAPAALRGALLLPGYGRLRMGTSTVSIVRTASAAALRNAAGSERFTFGLRAGAWTVVTAMRRPLLHSEVLLRLPLRLFCSTSCWHENQHLFHARPSNMHEHCFRADRAVRPSVPSSVSRSSSPCRSQCLSPSLYSSPSSHSACRPAYTFRMTSAALSFASRCNKHVRVIAPETRSPWKELNSKLPVG